MARPNLFVNWYNSTTILMQILRFDWLLYSLSISRQKVSWGKRRSITTELGSRQSESPKIEMEFVEEKIETLSFVLSWILTLQLVSRSILFL